MRSTIILLVLFSLTFVLSCQSNESLYTENMKPEDYFQRAQERADRGDYATALELYYKCKQAFPDNLEKNIWASYEIAFLYHKMSDDAKALSLLDELLTLYAQDKSGVLPKAPKALAERVRENILNKDKPNNQTADPDARPGIK